MPAGKRQQNAMLYTVITFVFFFIVSTVLAVVFYLQAEKHRTESTALQNQINDLASGAELQKIGAIVGSKQPRKSRLGTMVDYLNRTVSLIIGGLPEDKSAEVKVDTANRKVKDLFTLLARKHITVESTEPNVPTNELVTLLANQQFANVTEDFNEILKNELPPEKLEETWKATIDQLGAFKKQIGLRTEKQADYDVVLVTCEFEKDCLDVKIVYNDKKQVVGLFLAPTPLEILESYWQKPDVAAQKPSYIEIDDPNTIGLVRVIEKLITKIDNTADAETDLQEKLERLKNRFDDAMAASFEKEQTLLAEKEKYQQQVDDIKHDYNDLKIMLRQTSDQQVQTCMAQLEDERNNRKNLNQQLLKTEAELTITQERVKRTQKQLDKLLPPPDNEIAAYKPDGKIILIDESTKVVHLNLGSDDHVYQGLTFSIYEKNIPIPRDGKGKAEIEVFNVGKNISVARITSSNPKKPIILNDVVANLIWDSGKTNVFVVAGEFDLNADGETDYEAADKIKALIKKWGGTVADDISIDTDFLVLGTTPAVLKRPTFEQMEVDPMAMEKYEASLQKLTSYKEMQSRAQTLSIPVFNLERFLYFIGYKTLSARPDAFY
jgi:hypothetical protein